jgi:phenylpropionate dioxygenase-like ring-hydroxylating dioxygenase large terminal subunit
MPDHSASESPRCDGPSWNDIAADDSRKVPEFLLRHSEPNLGSAPVDTKRYTDPAFFEREKEKMWPNVWQFAAREEELPDPGDFVVYENVGRSYLVVRQPDGGVRAFYNVCLHRGRKLRTEDGTAEQFQCAFHGFAWNTDGTLKKIPCPWDFQHLKPEEMSLPEATTARWQGYIFVRENPEGPTIEEYLAPLPEHFMRWRHDECVTAIWVAKVVKANWKVTAEAFMEAYHSVVTHPQLLPFAGDANTKYSVWGDHVNLALTPFCVTSPHLAGQGLTEQWIIDQMLRYNGRSAVAGLRIEVPDGGTARRALAEVNRKRLGTEAGRDFSEISDAEMIDAFTYNVFPNFAPWGGFPPNVIYRWRPWPDQDHTLMEVRRLSRVPPGAPRPRAVPMRLLGEDESWSSVTELGALGSVFNQDWDNLPFIQEGLKASKNGRVQYANYQESRIRQFAQTLDKYLSA